VRSGLCNVRSMEGLEHWLSKGTCVTVRDALACWAANENDLPLTAQVHGGVSPEQQLFLHDCLDLCPRHEQRRTAEPEREQNRERKPRVSNDDRQATSVPNWKSAFAHRS
jgi:hypothetical protein